VIERNHDPAADERLIGRSLVNLKDLQ
jgi:hypothetical protein